jgi:ribosomal protein S18 acetylase RimI-like enzyme
MDFGTANASNYSLPELVEFLNRGFEDYFVTIQFTTVTFLNMLRKDGIDLTASQVLIVNGQPCGIALIARRGWTGRLAAMGIAKEARGKGAGSWFMDELIKEAYEREDHEMVLEVIEQNDAAVRLYRKSGFQSVRRLVGFIHRGKDADESERSDLQEIDLREMSKLISQHGWLDLPWQLSAESVAQMNPPACAYRKGQAYVAISNPDAEHLVIWSLLVEQNARGNGLGTDMLRSILAHHAGKTWHAPAIFPEEFEKVFERAGFEKENLSQWQMKLNL